MDSSQIRNQLKRKAYEDAGLQPGVSALPKVTLKALSNSESHTRKQKSGDFLYDNPVMQLIRIF